MNTHTIPNLAGKAAPESQERGDSGLQVLLKRAEQYAALGNPTVTQYLLDVARGFGLAVNPAQIDKLQGILQDNAYRRTPASAPMVNRRVFSEDQRKEMAKSGTALPDGSFPIATKQDLKNAIQAIGRAKDRGRAMAHIKKRARALGMAELLPATWKSLADSPELPEWFKERHDARVAEAFKDHELLKRYGQNFQIERPDYMTSEQWNALPPTERTLGAEVVRRQIRRNYSHALDQTVMDGWQAKSLDSGGHELSKFVDGVLRRGILVRKSGQTTFYLRELSKFASGSTATKLTGGEVRFNGVS
jgi:hypothetical protein